MRTIHWDCEVLNIINGRLTIDGKSVAGISIVNNEIKGYLFMKLIYTDYNDNLELVKDKIEEELKLIPKYVINYIALCARTQRPKG